MSNARKKRRIRGLIARGVIQPQVARSLHNRSRDRSRIGIWSLLAALIGCHPPASRPPGSGLEPHQRPRARFRQFRQGTTQVLRRMFRTKGHV